MTDVSNHGGNDRSSPEQQQTQNNNNNVACWNNIVACRNNIVACWNNIVAICRRCVQWLIPVIMAILLFVTEFITFIGRYSAAATFNVEDGLGNYTVHRATTYGDSFDWFRAQMFIDGIVMFVLVLHYWFSAPATSMKHITFVAVPFFMLFSTNLLLIFTKRSWQAIIQGLTDLLFYGDLMLLSVLKGMPRSYNRALFGTTTVCLGVVRVVMNTVSHASHDVREDGATWAFWIGSVLEFMRSAIENVVAVESIHLTFDLIQHENAQEEAHAEFECGLSELPCEFLPGMIFFISEIITFIGRTVVVGNSLAEKMGSANITVDPEAYVDVFQVDEGRTWLSVQAALNGFCFLLWIIFALCGRLRWPWEGGRVGPFFFVFLPLFVVLVCDVITINASAGKGPNYAYLQLIVDFFGYSSLIIAAASVKLPDQAVHEQYRTCIFVLCAFFAIMIFVHGTMLESMTKFNAASYVGFVVENVLVFECMHLVYCSRRFDPDQEQDALLDAAADRSQQNGPGADGGV